MNVNSEKEGELEGKHKIRLSSKGIEIMIGN